MNRKSEATGNLLSQGSSKIEVFSQKTHSQNFRDETLKSPLVKACSESHKPSKLGGYKIMSRSNPTLPTLKACNLRYLQYYFGFFFGFL